jgi:hypothetical protein
MLILFTINLVKVELIRLPRILTRALKENESLQRYYTVGCRPLVVVHIRKVVTLSSVKINDTRNILISCYIRDADRCVVVDEIRKFMREKRCSFRWNLAYADVYTDLLWEKNIVCSPKSTAAKQCCRIVIYLGHSPAAYIVWLTSWCVHVFQLCDVLCFKLMHV